MSIALINRMECSQRLNLKGFTLLEMVLVLFLVGLMASTTLMLTEGVEDQAKYDITKQRMDIIRKAIVGDTSRTVNGSPELSGFVADMGRLPGCLAELLELAEKTPATTPKTYESPCGGSPPETITLWDNSETSFGWRGPYLQVLPERHGDLRFRDGYGNSNSSDAINSGWIFISSAGTISLTSQGFKVADTADDIVASQLVTPADWKVPLPPTVKVTVKNQSAAPLPLADSDIVLRVYLSELSKSVDGGDGVNNYLTFLAASPALAGNNKTLTFTLGSSPSNIAIGKRAYALVCNEVPATGDPDDYVIFDGDCDGAGAATPNDNQDINTIRSFSVLPRQNFTDNLDWNIP